MPETSLHYRRTIDIILLTIVASALVLGVVRLFELRYDILHLKPNTHIDKYTLVRPAMNTWWGPRGYVFPDGGDYLAVLGRKNRDLRAVNFAIGEVLTREMAAGTPVELLVVPTDFASIGADPLTVTYRNEDGTERELEQDVYRLRFLQFVSPVPIEERDYNPTLTAELVERYSLPHFATIYPAKLRFVLPPEDASGAYALMASPGGELTYLVPLELVPEEDPS
jgi:hypothetical protein